MKDAQRVGAVGASTEQTTHGGVGMNGQPIGVVGRATGFRCAGARDESPEGERIVRRAVARAKEGDRDALRFLYLRYADNVYGYVHSILRDDHEAEDVTQQVFAKLMTVLVRYDPRGVPFVGWLLRLSHNAAIDHVRARRATPAEEIFGADERRDDIAAERTQSLRAALSTLPCEQREVVVLRHLVGLSPGEIADRMGRSESSVHGLHHRGRRALREELVHLGSAPATAATARVAA
jgi:RNA polymerase sigma-70 factor, ECF subfamily